ncbi:ACP receptor 2 long-like protein [Leptotrombidium deliense]|uniref:ACP receptor 2 long-like protein n=1 Tax=Leptotrombidium deliense TaxID=299467 RepID=A0A443SFR4_9ACAR|nr:ACP receptor 2 long-like protein [Leptotrombidium deliense]
MNFSENLNSNQSEYELLLNYKQSLLRESILEIIIYCLLFVIGGCANLIVLCKLISTIPRSSQMNYLLKHLTVADIIVIFVTITIEIIWRLTISWNTGQLSCKFVLTMRIFGLYLSSMILICISIDRYFAFVFPFSFNNAKQRNKRLLISAYLSSIALSIPQAFVYHIERHPIFPGFTQCMSDNYFTSKWKERMYNVTSLCGMYFVPLIVIVFCYSNILYTLHSNGASRKINMYMYKRMLVYTYFLVHNDDSNLTSNRSHLVHRAKRKTLKVALTITFAFIVCWTPYAFVVIWFQFDEQSARNSHPLIQTFLFLFAVSSSVVNPFVHSRHLLTDLRFRRAHNLTSTETVKQNTSCKVTQV